MSFYELCDDVMIDDMQIHSWIQQITVIAVRLLQDLTVKSRHLNRLRPAEALWTNNVLFQEQPMTCSVRIKAVALNLIRLGLITGNRSKTEFGSEGLDVFGVFCIKFSRRDPHWHIFIISEHPTLKIPPSEWPHICYALLWWPLSLQQICITLSKFRHTNVVWFRRWLLTLSFRHK